MDKFTNKVVLITGATSGIGAATARKFAEEGAIVILVGRNQQRGVKLQQEIRANGGVGLFVACDVSKESSSSSKGNRKSRYFV